MTLLVIFYWILLLLVVVSSFVPALIHASAWITFALFVIIGLKLLKPDW